MLKENIELFTKFIKINIIKFNIIGERSISMNCTPKEFQIIVINPDRCVDCESCMTVCSFVHEMPYIPLKDKTIGSRKRIELEWAISCDLCKGMKEQFIDTKEGKKPQCIKACPHQAIFVTTLKALEGESKIEAIKRIFDYKSDD